MSVSSIFREYDIRGIFEKELNEENAVKIGYLLGVELQKQGGKNLGIGYDARVHSKQIFDWFCSGVARSGAVPYGLGEIPTPVGYFSLFCDFNGLVLDGNVMITGSHNPPQYNGFKTTFLKKPFFGEEIYALKEKFNALKPLEFIATKPKELNVLDKYVEFLAKEFKHLEGFCMPLCIDCGNGVAGIGIKGIFDKLQIPYEGLYFEPDGNFPNHHPDPSEEENLKDVKKNIAKNGGIGFALDGDGDRLAVVRGERVYKGDELAIIFAHKIPNPVVIGEVKCSLNMYESINKIGKAIMYKTGHSNLKVKLKEANAHMAFEVSGHIFFNDRYFGYDDATYTLLRVLELLKEEGMEFDRILASLPKLYATDEIKIPASDEEKFLLMDKLKESLKNPPKDFPEIIDSVTIDGIRVIFKEGWGLIRASNTTPMLVTRFEAKSPTLKEVYQQKLLELLEIIKG